MTPAQWAEVVEELFAVGLSVTLYVVLPMIVLAALAEVVGQVVRRGRR